jgi:CheY-like chemotaxis protein
MGIINTNQMKTASEQVESRSGKTVLFIQSSRWGMFFTRRLLKKNEYLVMMTKNRDQAIRIIQTTAVDVLITQMGRHPELVLDLVTAIRNDEIPACRNNIIIIGFSGKMHTDIFKRSRQAGMNMFFYKPFSPSLLLDFINRLLN